MARRVVERSTNREVLVGQSCVGASNRGELRRCRINKHGHGGTCRVALKRVARVGRLIIVGADNRLTRAEAIRAVRVGHVRRDVRPRAAGVVLEGDGGACDRGARRGVERSVNREVLVGLNCGDISKRGERRRYHHLHGHGGACRRTEGRAGAREGRTIVIGAIG